MMNRSQKLVSLALSKRDLETLDALSNNVPVHQYETTSTTNEEKELAIKGLPITNPEELENCRQTAREALGYYFPDKPALKLDNNSTGSLQKCGNYCRRLFTEVTDNDNSTLSSTKSQQFQMCNNSKENFLIPMLRTQLGILKRQRIQDQKTGHYSSARRKTKKIKQYYEALDKVNNREVVDISQLPQLTPPKDSTFSDTNWNGNESSPDDEVWRPDSGVLLPDSEVLQPHIGVLEGDGDEDPTQNANKKYERKGKKKNYCLYCKKLVKEYCVHIERHHSDSTEGKALLSITEKSGRLRAKLKKEITDKLRKKANALYNELILTEKHDWKEINNEIILVKERHSSKPTKNNTTVCVHCKGWYKKDRLSVHLKTCKEFKSVKTNENEPTGSKLKTIKKHGIPVNLIRQIKGASEELILEVLQYMNDDDVKNFAINDPLIMRFGSEFHKSRREEVHGHYTASKIRDLSNLVRKMTELQPGLKTLEDCCNPANFDTLVEATLILSGYSPETGKLTIPSIAYRISQALKIAASIGESDSLCENYKDKTMDLRKTKMFKHFLKLVEKHWANRIGRIATRLRKVGQAGKLQKFSLEEDIVKMCSYFVGKYRELIVKLNSSVLKDIAYDELMELVVCHIMCLIRRRPVDFKRATLQHYTLLDRQDNLVDMVLESNVANNNDENNYIQGREIEQCRNFHIFYVPGKNLDIVPIVLTPLMKEVLDELVKHRYNSRDVKPEDKLFVMYNGKCVDPGISLRKMKKNVPLKSPETLTNNGLRHHAATFSKLHSNHPQYQDFLASALGHSLVVHKKHYELPTSVLQKLIVCPILHRMTLGRKDEEVASDIGRLTTQKVRATTISNENSLTGVKANILPRRSSDRDAVKCDINITSSEKLQEGLDESGSELEDLLQSSDSECKSCKSDEISEDELEIYSNTKSSSKNGRKNTIRTRWRSMEQEIIFHQFGEQILNNKLPSFSEVKSFFNKNKDILGNRTVQSVYTYIHNNVRRKQKNVSPRVKQILSKRQ